MKLTAEEVTTIVHKLVAEWKQEQLVHPTVSDSILTDRLIEIFLKELRVEDDLNKEVETMLEKYEKQFASGQLDRRKMYQMVKNQLAKERKIVL